VTRWSRLDNIFLLLLRAIALSLLIAAFTRPFWREEARHDLGDGERQRVALLVDTSASMRRGAVWTKAKTIAGGVIAATRPADEIAVYCFDGASRALLGFEESRTLDPARRQAVAKARVARLEPSWAATNLAQALIDTVAAIEDAPDATLKIGHMPRRVILISDLQQGSRLDALWDFEWPADVELDLQPIVDDGSNASLHALADAVDSEQPEGRPQRRVRVSNDAGSHAEEFALQWVDDRGEAAGAPIPVYVPPGDSRVVRVPRPARTATNRSLRLTGDTQDFDNTLYFADERHDASRVLYVGDDAA
jgi:hypothetical protein